MRALLTFVVSSQHAITSLVNRPALGSMPPADWPDQLSSTLMSVAPKAGRFIMLSVEFTQTQFSNRVRRTCRPWVAAHAPMRTPSRLLSLPTWLISARHVCWALMPEWQTKLRGGKPFTEEELQSSLVNKAPGAYVNHSHGSFSEGRAGCPPLKVISFMGAFHGRTMGVLSCTHSKVHCRCILVTSNLNPFFAVHPQAGRASLRLAHCAVPQAQVPAQ